MSVQFVALTNVGRSKGNTEVFEEKRCPSATLSTTNLTGTELGSKPGLRPPEPWRGI